MNRLLLVTAIGISFAAIAAEPKEGPVWSSGAGTLSCGRWLESSKADSSRLQFEQWVNGFVSGHNFYTTGAQAHAVDTEAISAYVDQYCRSNPLHRVTLAAAALVDELGGVKAVHEWKK